MFLGYSSLDWAILNPNTGQSYVPKCYLISLSCFRFRPVLFSSLFRDLAKLNVETDVPYREAAWCTILCCGQPIKIVQGIRSYLLVYPTRLCSLFGPRCLFNTR